MNNSTVSLIIDNQRIFADEGTTILEAARQNGIDIPTLCYHPRLAPMGHCRLCLVEIKGMQKPVTSCDNPVKAGMVVTTDSPRLRSMRAEIIELALATHPYEDCLTCVRTGSCELQEKAYTFQANLPAQLDRSVPRGEVSDNPDIIRDEEKCILCGRCIQVCRSGPGKFVYSLIGRGVNTRVAPVKDGKVVSLAEAGCIFCGQCVDLCPVAALTEVGRRTGGREWQLDRYPGVCTKCSVGCYLERDISEDRIIRVTVPREGDRVSWLCAKGRFGFKELDAAEKPADTQKLTETGYEPLPYREALEQVAAELKKIKETAGSQAIALVGSGNLSNEENYLLQKLARSTLETANIDLGLEESWADAYLQAMAVTGANVNGPTPADIAAAERITIIGDNLAVSHPVIAMAIDKAARFGDARVVRIADRAEEFTAWHLTDLRVDKNLMGALFSEVKSTLENTETDKAVQKSGLPADQLAALVDAMQHSKSLTIIAPTFFEAAAKEDICSLIALLEASGQLESGNSKVLMLSRFSNATGVLLTGGSPYCGPGFTSLPGDPGLNRKEILKQLGHGSLKAILIFGAFDDQAVDLSNLYAVVLKNEDNGKVKGADYLFTGETGDLKDGHFTNSAGQTRSNRTPVMVGGTANSDWRFICDLADALGARWNFNDLDAVRLEMKSVTPVD